MKKYIPPILEIEPISPSDIITCSFGDLEELPSSPDTPSVDVGGNGWGW